MLEKALTTALGVFLGFLFGLLSMYVRERIEFQRRASEARYMFLFLISELQRCVIYDPQKYPHVKIDMIFPYMDVVSVFATLGGALDTLRLVFMHWKNGEYFDRGSRENEAFAVQKQLGELHNKLIEFKPGHFTLY